MAIVVAAETVAVVTGGSFCVKGKYSVICSHLNPSSVVDLYAKDLDDFRSLVSWRQCHQDQMALALLQLFHIVSKNKECSSVSSWKICSRPQTHSILRMTVPLTSTLAITTGNTNQSSDNSLHSRTFDSSATKSDHWGLMAAIKSKHVTTPRKKRTGNRLAGNVGSHQLQQ